MRYDEGTVRPQGVKVAKVNELKSLGSTVESNGKCGREVKERVLDEVSGE